MIAALTGLLLVGCGKSGPPVGALGNVEGFAGGAATDEPRAVIIAEDVLSAGGTAADAAVALYFTLAVTYPIAASLGSGGVCLVFDGITGIAETLEFLPRPPAGGGSVALPGTVRAMSALHARYGRLRWAQLISPAEELARFGFPLSRAMARGIEVFSDELAARASLQKMLAGRTGAFLNEGELIEQIELSAILSVLRMRGAGDFHAGLLARNFVEASDRMGGAVTVGDLRDYLPVWQDTAKIKFGNMTLHTVSPPAGGGILTGLMWSMLAEGDRFTDAAPEERPHLLVEVSMRAFADRYTAAAGSASQVSAFRAHTLMRNYDANRHDAAGVVPGAAPLADFPPGPLVAGGDGTTSFVVGDRSGSAVACAITMNGPFGVGQRDPITGIIPALALPPEQSVGAFLGPLLVVRHHVDEVVLAVAASGGVAAPTAVMQTAVGTLLEERSLRQVIRAPRLFRGWQSDQALYEEATSPAVIDSLKARGHALTPFTPLGFVNALYCPNALGKEPHTCEFSADPRGFGLSVGQ